MGTKSRKFMRSGIVLFVLTFGVFAFTATNAFASAWSSPSNLSLNSTDSVYPSIAADMNGNLHVVWQDNASGNQEIYYKKFSWATGTWSSPRNISNTPYVSVSNSGNSDEPSVASDKFGNVHVVWMDYLEGNMEIYYVKYDSSTGSWGSRVKISNSPGYLSASPSIASDLLGNLYVVWEDGGDIYYRRNVGGLWDPPDPTKLPGGIAETEQKPKVAVDKNGRVSVVWQGDYKYDPGPPQPKWNSEIFYCRSSDGASWGSVQQLSASSPSNSLNPGVATDAGNRVFAVWESGNEIYSRKSSDGLSWDTLANLSGTGAAASIEPAITSDRVGNIHLVWSEYAASSFEIYHKQFSGSQWSSYTNISGTTTSASRAPAITADSTANPKVVWEDDTAGAFDVFYSGLSGPIAIYSTGFESAPSGWSFGDENPSSPGNLDYWGRTNIANIPGSANSGSYGLWCAAVGTNSTASEQANTTVRKYDKDMSAYAKLSVDLTLYQSASLSFYYKLPSSDFPSDVGSLYVCDSGGIPIGSALAQYSQVAAGWQSQTFDLSEFAGQPIILEWVWVSDADSDVGEGMYIDDVTVTGMPLSITGVSPSVRSNDKPYNITITGTGFKPSPTVKIGSFDATSVNRVDATKVTATVRAGLAYGTYDVTLTNPGGAMAVLYRGFKVSIQGDINGDGWVDLIDLAYLADAYASKKGDTNYDPNADLDGDGWVDLIDLAYLADNYGRSLP